MRIIGVKKVGPSLVLRPQKELTHLKAIKSVIVIELDDLNIVSRDENSVSLPFVANKGYL